MYDSWLQHKLDERMDIVNKKVEIVKQAYITMLIILIGNFILTLTLMALVLSKPLFWFIIGAIVITVIMNKENLNKLSSNIRTAIEGENESARIET